MAAQLACKLPLLDHIRQPAAIRAFRKAMEVSLADVGPCPGRRWMPWETASIRAVDTAAIGPLRVESW